MRPSLSCRLGLLAVVAAVLCVPNSHASGSTPAPVLTQHNDNQRTGLYLSETTLNTTSVNADQFGKLFTRQVDGQIYAQPLYVPSLPVNGGTHNVVFVATLHDSVYAFDADNPAAAAPLWQASLGTSAPITYTIPGTTTVGHDFGPPGYFDIRGEVGVLSTPVIDLASNTLYVLAFTREPDPATCPCQYAHRLHALDLTTGAEKFGGPVIISGTVPGGGQDGDGDSTHVTFESKQELQRTGLLLQDGVVYFAFASYGDQTPYHGWAFGYSAASLQQVSVWNATPNGGLGGIWQAGQGLVSDSNGKIYLMTGNGSFDPDSGDYSDSVVKLDPQGVVSGVLPVADSFTPFNQAFLNGGDLDLGTVGPLLITGTNLLLGGGKTGLLYLLDENDMGGYGQGPDGADRVVQSFQSVAIDYFRLHGAPIFWNSPAGPRLYVWGAGDTLKTYSLTIHSPVSATVSTTPLAAGSIQLAPDLYGGFLSLSASGSLTSTGILWAMYPVTDGVQSTWRGVLRAYAAEDIHHELWNSTQNPARDSVGDFAKFNVPTIANGKVYIGTFSNQLDVYGIMGAPWVITPPLSRTVTGGQGVTLTVAVSGRGPLNYQWFEGVNGDTQRPVGPNSDSYVTPPVTRPTRYWVRVTNEVGQVDSAAAEVGPANPVYLPLLGR